jgi:chromosomal replication initiation ATPase DnaA
LQQLSFNFPNSDIDQYSIEEFIVSKANKKAFDFVNNYDVENIKTPRIFGIFGSEFSGKTYLAKIWQKRTRADFLEVDDLEGVNLVKMIKENQAYIIENIDNIQNHFLLLQIFNIAQEKSSYLMITSNKRFSEGNYQFKDLSSRLDNIFNIKIGNPDDSLIKMLLIKYFSSMQLVVEDRVIEFLIKKIDRNFKAIHNLIKIIEFYSMEQKKKITISFIKEICQNI